MSNVNEDHDNSNTDTKDYFDLYIRGGRGAILSNFSNAFTALTHDKKFENLFAFDEMANEFVLTYDAKREKLGDNHIRMFQEYLQKECRLKTIGLENTHYAAMYACEQKRFHPVKDWLNKLVWDGTRRCDTWLIDCLGCQDNQYNRRIGKMFLMSMMARVMRPGCQCDHMIVLEGPQGIGKSSTCAILGGGWFSDHLPDISTKDSQSHLSGLWLIEISELHAFNRADSFTLKSYISRRIERYRPAYARTEIEVPRQCVFIGTTNQELYLKDETGGRRFWPVACGEIDLDRLRRDRAQLFAEALQCMRDGEQWWPDRDFELIHIKPQQEMRQEFDEWQNQLIINQHSILRPEKTTVTEILKVALGFGDRPITHSDSIRLGKVLQRLKARSYRSDGRRYWDITNILKGAA